MKRRIICDTCSAIKLAEFGEQFFSGGKLAQGLIILHPTIFAEVKKWRPEKKDKYKAQISVFNQVKAATGLRVDKKNYDSQEIIIKATRNTLGVSVGKSDIDQLISAIHFDLDLITNDSPFAELAGSLEVTVYEAEEIVAEAFEQKILTKTEIEKAFATWKINNEKKPSKEAHKKLTTLGLNP